MSVLRKSMHTYPIMPWKGLRISPCSLSNVTKVSTEGEGYRAGGDIPGTVHLPFFNIVSTALVISGRALATSSTCIQSVSLRRSEGRDETDGEVLERTRLLDVVQRSLEVPELLVNLLGSLFSAYDLCFQAVTPISFTIPRRFRNGENTNGLGFERFDGLDVGADVVCHRLERLENALGLVDDSLVLNQRAILGDVDGGGLGGQLVVDTESLGVSLAESLEGCDGL